MIYLCIILGNIIVLADVLSAASIEYNSFIDNGNSQLRIEALHITKRQVAKSEGGRADPVRLPDTDFDDKQDGLEPLDAAKHAINETKITNHDYYMESKSFNRTEFDQKWVDVKSVLAEALTDKERNVFGADNHTHLSNSYRRAVSHELSNFQFPFYGHPTTNLTIATGGFIYMGTTMHSWLAATQYIAPLMANFDTSQSERSNILFVETEDQVVIEWHEVVLKDQADKGNFTFEVQLKKNGDIYFLYKNIPMPVTSVNDQYHPRKVGLSDAYLMETPVLSFKKRVIYEYHRIEVNLTDIRNYTIIHMEAQKVCISLKKCDECVNAELTTFNCTWCEVKDKGETKGFCSDEFGLHRLRQLWMKNSCDKQVTSKYCAPPGESPGDHPNEPSPPQSGESASSKLPVPDGQSAVTTQKPSDGKSSSITKERIKHGMSAGSVVGVLFVMGTLLALIAWVIYAYYNPHTPSGQLLIRYRPSRWRWPGAHGDVRYTASVHM